MIENIASEGNSIIVGRGAPYILRNRPDAFHVFIYASTEEKILRLRSIGKSESEARHLVEEIDRDRAAFIHHYFGKQWPHRPLYHVMLNSQFGDEYVVNSILHSVAVINESYRRSPTESLSALGAQRSPLRRLARLEMRVVNHADNISERIAHFRDKDSAAHILRIAHRRRAQFEQLLVRRSCILHSPVRNTCRLPLSQPAPGSGVSPNSNPPML